MNFDQPKPEENFSAKETVNGFDIRVYCDPDSLNYEIRFPQIDLNDEATQAKGIADQVIIISDNPEDAKKVFEFTKESAKTEKDIHSLYLKSEEFARTLG